MSGRLHRRLVSNARQTEGQGLVRVDASAPANVVGVLQGMSELPYVARSCHLYNASYIVGSSRK